VLDPRISYEGMKLDYAGDESLAEYLERQICITTTRPIMLENTLHCHK
jgi:hypothetical protein